MDRTRTTCSKRSSRRSASRLRKRAGRAGERRSRMSSSIVIRTEDAPAPFQGAPYSQAIKTGGFVFVSGQLGLKPRETEIAGAIQDQTAQIFRNLEAILEAAGSGL